MIFNNLIKLFIVCSTMLSAQSMKNRLLVPIYVYPTLSFGYDSNFLKFSDGEIDQTISGADILGNASTFDSDIIKTKMKLFYSPVLSNIYETELYFTFSHSMYRQLKEKSYVRYSLLYAQHLGPYSWLKIGYTNLPEYFIRNYIDRDITGTFRYPCSFSSEELFLSYSFPVGEVSWLRFKVKGINEFYNSHFTEFDQKKLIGQIVYHSEISKRMQYSVSLSHGGSKNPTYNSGETSTLVDRSYLMDKIILGLTRKSKGNPLIEKYGMSLSVEQRLYDLESEVDYFDDWKFYFDSNVSIWSEMQIHEDIGLKVSYQYRNRKADSNPFGEFSWVEEVKDFSKHVLWFDFSYGLVIDLFY